MAAKAAGTIQAAETSIHGRTRCGTRMGPDYRELGRCAMLTRALMRHTTVRVN